MANQQLLQPEESLERLGVGGAEGQGLALGRTVTGNAIQMFWITSQPNAAHDIYLQSTESQGAPAVDIVDVKVDLQGIHPRVSHSVMRQTDNFHLVTNGNFADEILNRITNAETKANQDEDIDEVDVAIQAILNHNFFADDTLDRWTRHEHPPSINGLTKVG